MSLSREVKLKKDIQSPRHEALLNIARTAGFLEKKSQTFFGQFDMTEAQYNVLIVLKLEGRSLTQVEIGERLISSRANITALIDRLEAKGYVERKDAARDRRFYEIHMTKAGRQILDKVEKVYLEQVEALMAALSLTECQTISRALEKLRDSLRKIQAGGNV